VLRVLKWVGVVLVLAALSVVGLDLLTYDRARWRVDYALLKREMAQNYANLDWVRTHRRLDLAKLDAETQAAIDGGWSRVQAYRALARFVDAFADPHLRMRFAWSPSPPASGGGTGDAWPVSGCEAAGYTEDDHGFAPRWSKVAGWQPLGPADASFPAAVVAGTGVLRIASFDDRRYLSACRAVFRAGMNEEGLVRATRDRLNGEIMAALAQLRANGAERLLVDVSGNGGGSEWVREVVALLAPRRLTRAEPRLAAAACDRSGVWQNRPTCPVLRPEAPRASIDGKGGWRGLLAIHADRASASATEDFIAWLHGSKAAVLVGEKTMGVGCGDVNGGGRVWLAHARIEVRMPNCARFLNNGVNEIEGQSPDIPIAASDDASWAGAMAAALRTLPGVAY
jgi:hypothetical protein